MSSFAEFMKAQVHEIEVAKWLEGERLGCDPGEDFVSWWVKTYAKAFRQYWEESHKEEV